MSVMSILPCVNTHLADHFKAERVLFLKHQITEEEIRDFVADITDDETCELHSLSLKNISHITTQIWDLSSVNHKATESDGKTKWKEKYYVYLI